MALLESEGSEPTATPDGLSELLSGTAARRSRRWSRSAGPLLTVPDATALSRVFWRRDAIYRRALVAADALAAGLALLLGVVVAGNAGATAAWLLALPLVVLTAKLMGLYDRDELVLRKSTLDEAPKLFHVATLYALLAGFADHEFAHGGLSVAALLVLWLGFLVLAVVGRSLARRLAHRVAPAERCLIVGQPGSRTQLAAKLSASRSVNATVVGFLDLEDPGPARRAGDPASHLPAGQATLCELPEVIAELDVHRVILIPGGATNEPMLDAITRAKAAGVKVSILPRVFEVVGSSVVFDELDGVTVLGMRRFGLSRSSSLIKRSLDLMGAATVLIVSAPLAALIAVAIKLDSRGAVFFRQARVGRGGRAFTMLKFRSMIDDAEAQKAGLADRNEAQGLFKIADDPRITRVGGVIRRYSLDELPQLINVLRGEMSLVGPRPLIAEDDERVEGHHRHRLALSPGMTGPWQVLGSGHTSLNEMLNLDYLYGANWSLWTDVKILLRTCLHVAGRRGQ